MVLDLIIILGIFVAVLLHMFEILCKQDKIKWEWVVINFLLFESKGQLIESMEVSKILFTILGICYIIAILMGIIQRVHAKNQVNG
ncbi:MAG: hypothetical protein ACRC6X_02040 [Culicoidibacterales bacterium]